jgi:hypothetical protein
MLKPWLILWIQRVNEKQKNDEVLEYSICEFKKQKEINSQHTLSTFNSHLFRECQTHHVSTFLIGHHQVFHNIDLKTEQSYKVFLYPVGMGV